MKFLGRIFTVTLIVASSPLALVFLVLKVAEATATVATQQLGEWMK